MRLSRLTGGRSGKLARLTEMLEEVLAVGEKALVFTQFTEMGDMIQRHLQENFSREVIFLHGGVPKTKRDRMVERFRAVYYLLAESFDNAPFLLFRMRGKSRDEFVGLLGGMPEASAPEPPPVPPQPLKADTSAFWQLSGRDGPVPADLYGAASLPDGPTVLAATLGPLPFWRGEADFLEVVNARVGKAAVSGRKLVEG